MFNLPLELISQKALLIGSAQSPVSADFSPALYALVYSLFFKCPFFNSGKAQVRYTHQFTTDK